MNDIFVVDAGKRNQEVQVTRDSSGDFLTYIDEASGTVTYIGKAPIGSSTASGVWQIKKIETASTVTSVLFADGDSSFNNVWDNRASLSYS